MKRSTRRLITALLTFVAIPGCLVAVPLLFVKCVQNARRHLILQESQLTAPETGYQFPATAEIARIIVVGYWDPDADKAVSPFDVPQDCWDEIIASLSPSQRGRILPWVVIGELEIALKTGGKIHVDLFDVEKASSCPDIELIGAFEVSASRDSGPRMGYRGGYTAKLKAALKRAQSEYRARSNPPAPEGAGPR
jgi:hypothetical protein